MRLNHLNLTVPDVPRTREFFETYHANPDHPVLQDFERHMRSYASDTAAFDEFVHQWIDTVVVPD